jgi:hypothetical protein
MVFFKQVVFQGIIFLDILVNFMDFNYWRGVSLVDSDRRILLFTSKDRLVDLILGLKIYSGQLADYLKLLDIELLSLFVGGGAFLYFLVAVVNLYFRGGFFSFDYLGLSINIKH